MTTKQDAILFHNNGILDRRAFTLMGLSAKEGDREHIGFFGTGFKYALAVLLREGHTVHINSGDRRYHFGIRQSKFRNKDVNIIVCDICDEHDERFETIELPFTTHLGATWSMWQVYRELTTNALDEGGGVDYVKDMHAHMQENEGMSNVRIYVTGDEILAIHEMRNKYFLPKETTTIVKSHAMRAVTKLQSHDNVVYYKGMYTGTKSSKPTLFTYDFLSKQELTEDRTLRNTYFIDSPMLDLWCEHMEYDQLLQYLPKIAKDNSLFEHHFHPGSYQEMSDDFKRAVEYLDKHNRPIPMWARKLFNKSKSLDEQLDKHKLNKLENKMLKRALLILSHHGAKIDPKKVVICTSLPDHLLGMIEHTRGEESDIFISQECFSRGMLTLIGTLFEEWIHLVKGHDDCNREMQNYLIDRCASMMEVIYTVLHDDDDNKLHAAAD